MLKKDITPEIREKIKETYSELNNVSKTKESVNGLLDISLTFHNVKATIEWLDNDISDMEEVLHEINDSIESPKHYDILEEDYILEHKWLDKIFKIKIELVDQIFKDYSKHWSNLSWEEILRKYKLKPEVWSLIKNKLRLYKASDVISPYTAENSSEEELKDIIHDAIDENISATKEKMLDTYDKVFKKEAKKAMKQAWNFQYQLDNLRNVLENYNPKVVEFKEFVFENSDNKDFVITDLHIGKKNTDRILDDLAKIKQSAIDSPEQNINIICLWDIWENFSQTPMHSWQHITLDKDIPTNPFDLQLYIAWVFESLLVDLKNANKNVKFIWLTWNHDRVTKSNDDDILRQAWLVIYELIKSRLDKLDIDVKYFRETINTFTTESKHYILSHWEYWFNNKKPQQLLWDYWRQDRFNIILSWHTHQNKMEVWQNYAKIVVAPLAWSWDYDERLGLNWETGFTTIKDSIDWVEITNIILNK